MAEEQAGKKNLRLLIIDGSADDADQAINVLRHSGYLLKSSVSKELELATQAASRGELYLSPAISRTVVDDLLRLEDSAMALGPYERLTPREREVLQLVAEGHTNIAIAQMLQVSVRTVEKHRANLMSKLNVHDLVGFICVAIKHSLVFLHE